jgi:hypothetical protein
MGGNLFDEYHRIAATRFALRDGRNDRNLPFARRIEGNKSFSFLVTAFGTDSVADVGTHIAEQFWANLVVADGCVATVVPLGEGSTARNIWSAMPAGANVSDFLVAITAANEAEMFSVDLPELEPTSGASARPLQSA